MAARATRFFTAVAAAAFRSYQVGAAPVNSPQSVGVGTDRDKSPPPATADDVMSKSAATAVGQAVSAVGFDGNGSAVEHGPRVARSSGACAGDHGQPVGGDVCCGQYGTITHAGQTCPASEPVCTGYVYGQKWGTCGPHRPPAAPTGTDKWCNNDKAVAMPSKARPGHPNAEQCIALCKGDPACEWVGFRRAGNYCEFWGAGSCQAPHHQPGHAIYKVAPVLDAKQLDTRCYIPITFSATFNLKAFVC